MLDFQGLLLTTLIIKEDSASWYSYIFVQQEKGKVINASGLVHFTANINIL